MSEGELYGDDVSEFTVEGTMLVTISLAEIFLLEFAIFIVRDLVSIVGISFGMFFSSISR